MKVWPIDPLDPRNLRLEVQKICWILENLMTISSFDGNLFVKSVCLRVCVYVLVTMVVMLE